MKKFILLLAMVVSVTGLVACGGGGDSTPIILPTSTPTPIGTTVDLTAFKGVLSGTATGSQYNFPSLTGTDSLGRTWSGSYLLVADGATTFEAQSVTKSRAVITLQLLSGTPVSSFDTKYFQVADGSIYKIIDSDGVISVPTSQSPLPSTPKVGDAGTIGTFNNSDGSTTTVTWALIAGVNGSSQLAIFLVFRSGSTVIGTEADTYFLDASGNPTRFAVSVTIGGDTVNLSGNRL